MSTYNRQKLGEVRCLANRANIAGIGVGAAASKPSILNVKDRVLYSRRINDENQDVAAPQPAKGKNEGVLLKKVSSLSTLNASGSRSKIPVFNFGRPQQEQAKPQQQSLPLQQKKIVALQSLHPVISRNMRIENIDADRNIFLLGEYAEDIYKYLGVLEEKYKLNSRFMREKNSTFTESTRGVLVDWICSVHAKFSGCQNETLYLAVSIIDRFLAISNIPKDQLQLLGATAFFVASKFEEIYYPDVKDIVMLCDDLYTKRQVLLMELKILKVLNFTLGAPLVIHFLRRASKAAHSSARMHMMSKYLCELSLVDYEIASWAPSLTAAVALYLTLRMWETNEPSVEGDLKDSIEKIWSHTIEYYTNYTQEAVLKYAPYMCRVIVKSATSKFQNVRKKYSDPRYIKISESPMLMSPFVRQFAAQLDSPRNICGGIRK